MRGRSPHPMHDHSDHDGRPFGRGRGGRRRGPGRHGRGGRRSRVSRGEIRNAILVLLSEQDRHGYDMMQEMEARSGGGWQASPGSVYPTLQQLTDEGLVVSRSEDGRNVFSLTDAGREAQAELDEPPVWERFSGEGAGAPMALKRSMFQLGAAARQVATAGSDAQVEEAVAILTDARKALYRLLADAD